MIKTNYREKKEIPNKRNGYYYEKICGEDYKLVAVTQILQAIAKPALVGWAAKSAARIALDNPYLNDTEVMAKVWEKRDTAADKGKLLHGIMEKIGKGEKIDLTDISSEQKPYVKAFTDWCESYKPTPLFLEKKVISLKHEYAGTADIVAMLGKELWIVDIKTGKGVYREMGLQQRAYFEAAKEMNIEVSKMAILHLKSDGTFSFIEMDEPFEVFLNVKKVWEWIKEKE